MARARSTNSKGKPGAAKEKNSRRKKVNTEEKKQISVLRLEIYGVLIAAVSVLIGLSMLKQTLGEFGHLFRNLILGIFGAGGFIFPLITLSIGLTLIFSSHSFRFRRRFTGICLMLYNIILIYQVQYTQTHHGLPYLTSLSRSYQLGASAKGGGAVSELLDVPLLFIFGSTGAYVVLFFGMLICLLITTEISLGEQMRRLVEELKKREKRTPKEKNRTQEDSTALISTGAGTIALPSGSAKPVSLELPLSEAPKNAEVQDRRIKILDFMKNDAHLIDQDLKTKSEAGVEIRDEPKSQSTHEGKKPKKDDTAAVSGAASDLSSKDNVESLLQDSLNEPKTPPYKFPSVKLMNENRVKVNSQDKKELLSNAKVLEDTLKSFGVSASVIQVSRGPSVTRYELQPSQGVKVSRITNLADDLALNLAASAVRIEAPIPGKAAVGIEVPNRDVVTVSLREVIESEEFVASKSSVAFGLGKDISGKCIVTDIAKMPHLLIAGATGSGKSVCINTLITSLIYKSSPDHVKMLMIDPKVVELSVYNGIPHLLIPVVTDPKKASSALYWAVNEMTNRYKLFADNNVRNIESFNLLAEKSDNLMMLPQIVIIIDELADLMMAAPNDVEDTICRLAQMARAAGMHLVIATQRPSVDVITGVIKANIPSRISFAVSSQIDSRTILDMAGAEKLLGKGDMLFMPIGESKPIRIQGAFISEKEVENIVEFLKISAIPEYDDTILEEIENTAEKSSTQGEPADELLPEAIRVAVDYGQVSASMLQRRLRVGFNRAARLVEEMESRGLVGAQDGSKPRQVLISKEQYENEL